MSFLVRTSIRTRIVVMALIPLVGLGAVGLANGLGSASIGTSLTRYDTSRELASVADHFRLTLAEMQRLERDFRLKPDRAFADAFRSASDAARADAERLRTTAGETGDAALGKRVDSVRERFEEALRLRADLGLTGEEGLETRLSAAASALEEAIDGITTMGAGDGGVTDLRRLQTAMRDDERSFARGRDASARADLEDLDGRFAGQLASMIISPRQKKSIGELAKTYLGTFRTYADTLVAFDTASANLNRTIDGIGPSVKQVSDRVLADMQEARTALDDTKRRTDTAILGVIGLSLLVSFASAFVVGRGIVRPLSALGGAMDRLTHEKGDVPIPFVDDRNEIGDMARGLAVLKQSMTERDRLAVLEGEERDQKALRAQNLDRLVRDFEARVGAVVGSVEEASGRLHRTAETLAAASRETERRANEVAEAARHASGNVEAVSASSDALARTIVGVSANVHESTRLVQGAVAETRATDEQVQLLSEAARSIGQAVTFIEEIAAQTNLLALNATIEAARAGEAGRGFGVVATEVKQLASQTARATEEIAAKVEAIQASTLQSIRALQGLGGAIGKIDQISEVILVAVDDQSATTGRISTEAAEAARSTATVGAEIAAVSDAAAGTGEAAEQVFGAARQLVDHGTTLRTELERFLGAVRAA